MKPHRIRMTHNLLLNYGLYKQLEIYRPSPARDDELTRFHSDEYIEFLRLITPDNQHEHLRQLKRYNVGEDCPVFDGLYQICKCYTGGSIGGAVKVSSFLPPGAKAAFPSPFVALSLCLYVYTCKTTLWVIRRI